MKQDTCCQDALMHSDQKKRCSLLVEVMLFVLRFWVWLSMKCIVMAMLSREKKILEIYDEKRCQHEIFHKLLDSSLDPVTKGKIIEDYWEHKSFLSKSQEKPQEEFDYLDNKLEYIGSIKV